MVHLQPCGERAVFAREQDDAAGVLDHGVDLGAIANDVGVGEKTPPLPPAVTGDGSRIETFKGPPEGSLFFKIVSHDKPAWLISGASRTKRELSSATGKPYSRSW